MSIPRVKFRMRFWPAPHLIPKVDCPRRAWPGKHGRSRGYQQVTPTGAQISLELIPQSLKVEESEGSIAPESYCDYVPFQKDQLGTGCIKPWCSVVSTGEPCINPVSPTRVRPAPLYGDLGPTLVLSFILLLYWNPQPEEYCSGGDFYVLRTLLFYQQSVLLYFYSLIHYQPFKPCCY